MKLYTEEQVRELLREHISEELVTKHLSYVTAIELPTDEEIEEIIKPFEFEYTKIGFRACAEWINYKIQGGNQ